jgi:hypothetical protein
MQFLSSVSAPLPWAYSGFCNCCLPGSQSSPMFAATRGASGKTKSGAKKKARATAKPAGPRRIDVHHHFVPPKYVKDLGAENLFNGSPGSRAATYDWTPAMSLADMNKGGTQTARRSPGRAPHRTRDQ